MPSPQRQASPALPEPRPAGFKSLPTTSPNSVADHAAMAALPAGAADLITARLAMSKASNLIANLRGFLAAADPAGRVHPQVNTLRAKTARISITNPALQTLKKHDPRLAGVLPPTPGTCSSRVTSPRSKSGWPPRWPRTRRCGEVILRARTSTTPPRP